MKFVEHLLEQIELEIELMEKAINQANEEEIPLKNRYAAGYNDSIVSTLYGYARSLRRIANFGRESLEVKRDIPDIVRTTEWANEKIKPVKYSRAQREERSKDIVWFYLSNQYDNKGIIPGVQDVAELLEIDSDLVEEVMESFKRLHDVSQAI